MSGKQQLPSLSLLYSIHEDVPEQTLDEADVDSYFYRNIDGQSSCASQQGVQ